MNAKVKALATYVPKNRINNEWFIKYIETNDEWIVSRTGIKERRYADQEEYTSDLCVEAALNLLKNDPEITLHDVDFIIVATSTPDHILPSVASQVQNRLDIKNSGSLDISAACAGFVYGIILAKGLIAAGTHKKILVFGAETLSKIIDLTDRTSCILFGDGAGVVLIEASTDAKILNCITGTDGSHGKDLYLSNLSSIINNEKIIDNRKIHQNGKVVFKWAIQTVTQKIKELLIISNLQLEDINYIILHSANLRIIDAIANDLNYSIDKMLTSIEFFGNTSSASIPLAWDQGYKNGKLKTGNKLLLLGFGGGLTFAGVIIEI
jgi:3-oxoacyl-[acyl-carrier-protein] synthase-3